MTAAKLQRLLFWGGWVLAALLLGRFAIDFIHEMPALLAVPFVLLVIATLGVAALNNYNGDKAQLTACEGKPTARLAPALLLITIPLGLIASSLDCTGLSLSGCTPFCTFIKTIWVPLLALVCIAYAVRRERRLLTVMMLMSLVPLTPHCLCLNVGNGWWIERIGASPTCYAWGFAVSLIALGALTSGRRAGLSLLINGAIIGGATVFFVSHHYFHFPW